jgi:hypothetical protein
MSAVDVRGAVLVGDPIPHHFTQGIYMAELHAVVRALMSLPVTWKVTMVLDSKSSITAINKFVQQEGVSMRSKLRMPGRPMLGMVTRLVKDREDNGGSVTWVHVNSHSDRMDENAVGNRCADLIAGSSRNVSVPVLNPLRLELGERWLFVTRADGSVLYDDVRRAALDRARDVNLDLWKSSPSQNWFANVTVLDLCSQMLSDDEVTSDRAFVKFLLCVTSNTLQYVWVDSAAAGDKVQQRCCGECDGVVLDVKHVFECTAKESKRKEWCTSLIEYLKPFVSLSAISTCQLL